MLKNSKPTTNNFIVPFNSPYLLRYCKITYLNWLKLITLHGLFLKLHTNFSFLIKLTQETSNYAYKVRKKIGVMFNTCACIH